MDHPDRARRYHRGCRAQGHQEHPPERLPAQRQGADIGPAHGY